MRACGALCGAVLAVACQSKAAPPPAARAAAAPQMVHVYVDPPVGGTMEILLDGKKVANQRIFDLPAPARGTFTVRFLRPDGWTPVATKASTTNAGLRLLMDTTGLSFDSAPLLIDNRGGAATDVSVGEMHFPVAAGATATFSVPLPNTSASISAGGVVLGTLDRAKMPRNSYWKSLEGCLLVDVAGGHCYQATLKIYTNVSNVRGGPASRQRIGGSRVGIVKSCSGSSTIDFLQQSPGGVMVQGGVSQTARMEILDARCH